MSHSTRAHPQARATSSAPEEQQLGDSSSQEADDEDEDEYQDLEEEGEEFPLHYSVSGQDRKGICLLGCRYDAILRVALESRFRIMVETEPWSICWSDLPLLPDKILEMKQSGVVGGKGCPRIQKFNHFPAMYEICRKDRLGRNLNRFKRLFPKDFNFYPKTWDLPSDMGELTEYGKKHKDAIFILKPDSGCQGKGIFLCNDLSLLNPFVKCVCQLYVPQPLLLDGFKFDLRIYVLITSVDPLRIYIYKDGLARFATLKYQAPDESNLDMTYMHLTNYSLNKFSDGFDGDEDSGSKRPVSDVYAAFSDLGYDLKKLEKEIDAIIVKSVICVAPALRHGFRSTFSKREQGCLCFELLGFDILIDRHFKPLIIEINASPSFNLDTPADSFIKLDLLRDLFAMLHIDGDSPPGTLWKALKGKGHHNKFNIQRRPGTAFATSIPDALKDQFVHEDEEQNRNNFRLIFSEDHPGRYAKFLDQEYFLMQDTEELDQHFFSLKKTKLKDRVATPINKVLKRGQPLLRPPRPIRPRVGHLFKKDTPVVSPPTPPPPESPEEEGVLLTPSQRVQKALRQLKYKNLEKFKRLTELNRDVLRLELSPTPTPIPPPPDEDTAARDKPSKSCSSSKSKNKNKSSRLVEELPNGGGHKSRGNSKQKNKKKVTQGEESSKADHKEVAEDRPITTASTPTITIFQYSVRAIEPEEPVGQGPIELVEDGVVAPPEEELEGSGSPSFTPQMMDMSEERRRIRHLASRKRAIGILGVAEMAREVVEMVSAGSTSIPPVPSELPLDQNANQTEDNK